MYPKAYVEYLVYFHGIRDYFQCHEVLEEEWMKEPRGERKHYWRGLIQIAVSLYHHRRGNFPGANKMMNKAMNHLKNEKKALEQLALHYNQLMELLDEQLKNINAGKPYKSIDLPITDQTLIQRCQQLCDEKGCTMGNPSDLTDEKIIHKHQLPDREQIISKREMKKHREN